LETNKLYVIKNVKVVFITYLLFLLPTLVYLKANEIIDLFLRKFHAVLEKYEIPDGV